MLIRAMLLLITGMLALCATGDDFAPARPMPSLSLSDERVDVIAFGSCFNGSSPDHIYSTIQKAQPDVFLFIGDNVYAGRDGNVYKKTDNGWQSVAGSGANRTRPANNNAQLQNLNRESAARNLGNQRTHNFNHSSQRMNRSFGGGGGGLHRR